MTRVCCHCKAAAATRRFNMGGGFFVRLCESCYQKLRAVDRREGN